MQEVSTKSWNTTFLLCILVGTFGIHRFYTGHILYGLVQMFTLGGCFVWSSVDLILLAQGKYTDSKGHIVKKREL